MDESDPSKDDSNEPISNKSDGAKRLKSSNGAVAGPLNGAVNGGGEGTSGTSSGKCMNASSGDPSSSGSSAFRKSSSNSRLRNYRNSKGEDEDDDNSTDPTEARSGPLSQTNQLTAHQSTEEQRSDPEREASQMLLALVQGNQEHMEEGRHSETTEDNDNDWEDYEENDDDDDSRRFSTSEDEEGGDDLFSEDSASSSNSNSTAAQETDADNNEPFTHPVLNKMPPKHEWFVVNELANRQIGYSSKLLGRELFQRKCYGSLHCVSRLELMYKLEEHAGCVNSLNFHPDGTLLASGSDDLKVVIWDWKLGNCLTKYRTKHKGNVFQSKFLHLSGDLHIASCARDGQVRLAQLSKEEGSVRSLRLLGSHRGPCHKLIVLPDQPQIILSAGEDGVVLSHDVRGPKSTKAVTVKEDGKEVALYSIHGHPLKTHEFCVSGRDTTVRIYDQRKSNKPAACFTPFVKHISKSYRNRHVTCAVYNYNGSEILASYSESDIFLFDVKDPTPGKFIHQYQGHRNGATIKGVNFFGPKSEFVVSGSDCGHLYFWERNTEALVQWLLADDNGVVNCLEPHPQLPFICTSGLDWDIKVWVPSCEDGPNMQGLQHIVRDNAKKTSESALIASDINESQMLWMLWRHLRNGSRLRTTSTPSRNLVRLFPQAESNSSGSDSISTVDSDNDDFDRAPNCNTS